MKLKTIIPLILMIASCSNADEIYFKCDHTMTYDGDKVHISIVSDLPAVTICYDDTRMVEQCLTVVSHYYGCVSISVPENATLSIEAESKCYYSL